MSENTKQKQYSDRTVRQSQLISPWGVGAIVPFPDDETLMIAGIDSWVYGDNPDTFRIDDQRLQRRLSVSELRLPPDFRTKREDSDNHNLKIMSVRFPLWHFCPVCGKMKKVSPTQKYQDRCDEHKYVKLVPERFIVVCEEGHIDDFPIAEWIHSGHTSPYDEENCKIRRISAGKSAALSSVRYKCSCGATRSMAGAFNENALERIDMKCTGLMPWLGKGTSEHCDKPLRVVQRGASNVWFPNVVSSIKIPTKKNKTLQRYLDTYEPAAKGSLKNGNINRSFLKGLYDSTGPLKKAASFEQFLEGMKERVFGISEKNTEHMSHGEIENEYRKTEYNIIKDDFGDDFSELHSVLQPIDNYSKRLRKHISNISSIPKLTATRAFVGFSRLRPDADKSYYEQRRKLSKHDLNWVPAVTTRGEGIFIEFHKKKINQWASRPDVMERVSMLNRRMKDSLFMHDSGGDLRPQFVMIHTFSHLIINQLTYECGYSASAIRERIYCEKTGEEGEMYGVLIYTASGDSEGTMGGLVQQVQPEFLNKIFDKAIDNAKWCSTDPVCIESTGQGTDSLNLAACHNCALLPETSCEFSNRLLDRGLLIGTLNNEGLGFFNG